MLKLVRFSRFGECPFGRDQRSQLTTTPFQIFFCNESCKYMSTLGRKVFFGGTSEMFSSLGLKFLRFGRDQRSQLNNDTFSKKISVMEVVSMCLPYLKRYFQWQKWNVFFFRAQIIQIFLFEKQCQFGKNQRSQFNNNTFSKNFSGMKVSGMCLPYVKSFFSVAPVKCFFL